MTKPLAIYTMANDRVLPQVTALIGSIRRRAGDVPVLVIPYNSDCAAVMDEVESMGARMVPIDEPMDFLDGWVRRFDGVVPRPRLLRKMYPFFGEHERFLFLDADILVFEPVTWMARFLDWVDVVTCDCQRGVGEGSGVFSVTPPPLPESMLANAFNTGMWLSKRGLLGTEAIASACRDLLRNPGWMDLCGVSDQPVINYALMRAGAGFLNMHRTDPTSPGYWAGDGELTVRSGMPFDPRVGRVCRYLHWASIKMLPGAPFHDIWQDHLPSHLKENKP